MSNHSLLQGIFSNPGTEPRSLTLQADSLPSEPPEKLMPAAAAAAVTSVVSDSVRPHRGQPTRLPHPWDSPGKNTGVGCHFLLQCMKVISESEVSQSCPTLSDPMDCSLLHPWDFPGYSLPNHDLFFSSSSILGSFNMALLHKPNGMLPSLQQLWL